MAPPFRVDCDTTSHSNPRRALDCGRRRHHSVHRLRNSDYNERERQVDGERGGGEGGKQGIERRERQERERKFFNCLYLITPWWEWADPGGTAIPGQPVEKSEQAPASSPSSKNQFNIEVP